MPAEQQLYQKKTPTLVLSCETCEIFKNIYFEEYLLTTASKNQYVTEKTIHRFLSQNYEFCAVFANLFYKNIRSSLLC